MVTENSALNAKTASQKQITIDERKYNVGRVAKPELDKLKERILLLSVPEIEILLGYAEAVLDVREADAEKRTVPSLPPETGK